MDTKQVIQQVKQVCQQRGVKLTPIRQQVLELLMVAGGPVKAYDLLEQLTAKQGKTSNAPPTIYRALDFLLDNHFIHKLESINAYVSCVDINHDHHGGIFLICRNCQDVTELHTDQLDSLLDETARQQKFKADKRVIEMYGTCRSC